MNLHHLRIQLAQLRAALPEIASTEGAAVRNARRIARIAAEPEGQQRTGAVMCTVFAARHEEPEGFAALLHTIGQEPVALAFPDGPPQPYGDPDLRSRARAWKEPAGFVCRISAMLREQIAREAVAP